MVDCDFWNAAGWLGFSEGLILWREVGCTLFLPDGFTSLIGPTIEIGIAIGIGLPWDSEWSPRPWTKPRASPASTDSTAWRKDPEKKLLTGFWPSPKMDIV